MVADQIGRATSAKDLASGIIVLTTTGAAFGTHNITNSGDPASWVDVATTFELAARSQHDVADTTTAAYFAARSGCRAQAAEQCPPPPQGRRWGVPTAMTRELGRLRQKGTFC